MKKRRPQLTLPGFSEANLRTEHGGNVRKGFRKTARPLATRTALHVVMRSSRARGEWNFLRKENQIRISQILRTQSQRHGVRLERWVNVGNHLHLYIRSTRREGIQNFLRTVPALVARLVTGARRGKSIGPFWDGPVYTRIFRTGFSEWKLREYLTANAIEARLGSWARAVFLAKCRGKFPATIIPDS